MKKLFESDIEPTQYESTKSYSMNIVLICSVLGILILGIYPDPFLQLLETALAG